MHKVEFHKFGVMFLCSSMHIARANGKLQGNMRYFLRIQFDMWHTKKRKARKAT